MRLRNINFMNIGPYGNKLQQLTFSEEGALWQITGKSGSGKSFLVNLPKILYYGRLDRFKKEDISNRLNKHGVLYGEVEVGPNINIEIERRFSPQELIVKKNGEDIGKSGITNYQDYIDLEVIGLPYHIFANVISLSVNDFKSFISMSPGDKRIIIDKLFAMEIINEMNKLLREDLRKLKNDINTYDVEIMSLKKTIDSATNEMTKLKERVKKDNNQELNDITKKLLELKPKYDDAVIKIKDYQQKEKDIKKSYEIFNVQKTNINNDLKHLNKQIALYNQDKCPTCETPFSEKRFELLKGELNEKIKLKNDELEILISSESKYEDALEKIQSAIKIINDFIIQVKSTYQSLQKQYEKLKQDKPVEFSSIENIISKNTIEIKKKETSKINLDDDFKYKSILEQLYSEDGIKKKILESYLPTLNREIEHTLCELHFPYTLIFNNNFDPLIEHLGIEINVDTLSTGEKKKVDLAVLISIIKMLKRKYPALNIFMLDEVLSSIDGDGIYDIIGLLQRTAKELKMNIFVINHAPLPVEFFDYKIAVDKKDGFSDLTLDYLNED